MNIQINSCNMIKTKHSVKMSSEGITQDMGNILYDSKNGSWKVEGPILLCLKILTSNQQWRRGNLGKDFTIASSIVMQVLGAWFLLTSESASKNALLIHKLDIPQGEDTGTIDMYSEFRPLAEQKYLQVN